MAGELNALIKPEVDASALVALAKDLKREADSKQLRKDLVRELRAAVKPGVDAVKSKLRSMPHGSAVQASPAMGSYLASRTRAQVKTAGKSAGVSIKIAQTPSLRGFKLAARRINSAKWRHQVYGNERVWVTQVSPMPGFFDDTLAEGRDQYRAAVIKAMDDLRDRLTRREYKPSKS